MKFLEIKSKGEMEIQAISLIGASTKRGDPDSIGMFGSGLKYAVASIMRQERPFAVFSGNREIKLTTKEVVFGKKTFNQIYIDGNQTSLTDTMGTEDWTGVFPFIREIYSNALDEDKFATIKLVEDIKPQEGFTKFYIQADEEILNFMTNFKDYFIYDEETLWNTSGDGIHRCRKGTKIYRKGILAYDNVNVNSIFSYNLENIDINESRVIKNRYQVEREVAALLEKCDDKRILRLWISSLATASQKMWEHDCILDDWYSTEANPNFVDVILENTYYPLSMQQLLEDDEKKGRVGLPLDLLKRFIKYAPDVDILGLTSESKDDNDMFLPKEANEHLLLRVGDAVTQLKATAYSSRLESDIKYCSFMKKNVLGYASSDNVIWLSIKLETYSTAEVAKIIIEEQEHIHSGYGDESRAFQDHLFNLFYNQLIVG